jgi:hypothetical protein
MQVEEALAAISRWSPPAAWTCGSVSRLLTPGDFGFVPAGFSHGDQIVEDARMMGTLPAGSSGSSSTWAPRPITPPRSSRRSSRTSRACRRPRGSTHVARRPAPAADALDRTVAFLRRHLIEGDQT